MNTEGLLRKIYELYGDFALKNPFYSLDMPIRFVTQLGVQIYLKESLCCCFLYSRCELFDTNLQRILDQTERSGLYSSNPSLS